MKFKNTLIISSYVLLVALIFSGSYVIGKTSMQKPMPKPTAAPETEVVDVVSEQEVRTPLYEVTAEEGKLIIYKCIGNTKSVVTSEDISESVFPREDMEELRKGVKFDRLDSAQQMFENFVS